MNVSIPFRLIARKNTISFDATLVSTTGEAIALVEHGRIKVKSPGLRSGWDDSHFELLGEDGVPLFQVYVDASAATIYVGGRLTNEAGEEVIALPGKVITRELAFEGLTTISKDGTIYTWGTVNPVDLDFETQRRSLERWFEYDEGKVELDTGSFGRFLELLQTIEQRRRRN
jgi:hypothetical protein